MVDPVKVMVTDLQTGDTSPLCEKRKRDVDIADRLDSASYNGVSRTLRSNHCREAAEAIRALRKAVRGLAIARHSRMVSGGAFIPSGGSCELCNSEWAQDEAEHHAEGCLAKPTIKSEERPLA